MRRLKYDLLNSKVCIFKVKDNMKTIKSNFLNFPPMHVTTKCKFQLPAQLASFSNKLGNFIHQITARKDNCNKQSTAKFFRTKTEFAPVKTTYLMFLCTIQQNGGFAAAYSILYLWPRIEKESQITIRLLYVNTVSIKWVKKVHLLTKKFIIIVKYPPFSFEASTWKKFSKLNGR